MPVDPRSVTAFRLTIWQYHRVEIYNTLVRDTWDRLDEMNDLKDELEPILYVLTAVHQDEMGGFVWPGTYFLRPPDTTPTTSLTRR